MPFIAQNFIFVLHLHRFLFCIINVHNLIALINVIVMDERITLCNKEMHGITKYMES